jgi:hypothetical protein
MISNKSAARRAGLLYVLLSIPAMFALLYVPSKINDARDLAAHEQVFRWAIAANLVSQSLFIWVALALHRLFKQVDEHLSWLMVLLNAAPVPIVFIAESSHLAMLRNPAQFAQLEQSYYDGIRLAEFFWGAWLIPLAFLILRSRLVPRILGAMLLVAAIAYFAESLTRLVMPELLPLVKRFAGPMRLAELLTPLWLLVMGASESDPESTRLALAPR